MLSIQSAGVHVNAGVISAQRGCDILSQTVAEAKIDFLLFFQKSLTIAFLYGFSRLPFAGKIKNGISAEPKVVSEIPYTLQLDSENSLKLKWLQISKKWLSLR